MYQQHHPFQQRRFRRRQNEYQQAFLSYNFFEQQQSNLQNGQNLYGLSYNQQYANPYQKYPQPYQNTYQPYFGNMSNGHMNEQFMNIPYPTPYPKSAPYFKAQPSGIQTVISQFKKSDGQLDFNKMMDTAGQMMSAVNQMGGLFKGVTSMFK